MLDKSLGAVRRLIPRRIFAALAPSYHWSLAFLAALIYGFPSRKIKVIAVTGTKGKSTTTEIISAALERAGRETALSNTIRYKIGDESFQNNYKMSMPGRFFAQRLISRAVKEGCQYLVMEMTSQGSQQYRHRFIDLDTLVVTNISPEHIEAHGSYENYVQAKLNIAANMLKSKKAVRTIIVNAEDGERSRFLEIPVENKITYSLTDLEPYSVKTEGLEFTLAGRTIRCRLSGVFNLANIAAAWAALKIEEISANDFIDAVESLLVIPGRVQKIEPPTPTVRPMDFKVIVDYAHTPDSLEKLYQLFQGSEIIGVLGGTGGGRDSWKRAEMGRLADRYCSKIFLTDEDPYDEDPNKIVADVAAGIATHPPQIIMDRRQAIAAALAEARPNSVVLITGKGTDPYIMGPKGSKVPWSDSEVALEELMKLLNSWQSPIVA